MLYISVCVVDLCSCAYWFVEQPSNTFPCDPYESAANLFSTRCMVEHTVGDGSSLEIEWYYKESPDGPAHLLTSSDATIQTTVNCGLLKSVLTLPLAGSVDNQGNRFYFCRVNLNGKRLNDSQEFKLFSPEIISGVQPACTINQTTQSELKRRCIAPMTPGESPKPMPTTTQPQQPATTNIISLSTSLHIMPTTSPLAIITESTDYETTSTNAPTTTTNESEPDDNGGNDHESDGTDVGLSSEELTLIYVCISVAAGFLILVISVLVVCVCVWNRFDTEFHHS